MITERILKRSTLKIHGDVKIEYKCLKAAQELKLSGFLHTTCELEDNHLPPDVKAARMRQKDCLSGDRRAKMKNSDRIISVGLIIFSVLGFCISLDFKDTAKLLPQIVFISLFLSSSALLVQSTKNTVVPLHTEWNRWLLSVCMITVYVVAVSLIGFYAATFIFIAAMMYLFGIHDLKLLVTIPFGFNLMVYIVFAKFLGIIVPAPLFL